jgi:hypothetical protein
MQTASNYSLKLTVFGVTPPAEHVARRDAGAADAVAVDAYAGLQHNEDRQSQNRPCGCVPYGETVNGKWKGVMQWETKARRIRTRVGNRG